MSGRRQLVAIPVDRRNRARRRLGLLVHRRVPPASVLAVVDAAADALAEGRVGAAHDLLTAVCSPARAERVLLEMLDDEPAGASTAAREAAA